MAESADNWISAGAGALSGSGLAGLIAYYMLVKWSPKVEENHRLQLQEQRVDLLALIEKEKELSKAVIQILSDARHDATSESLKTNAEAIKDIGEKIDDITRATKEVLRKLDKDTTIKDELARAREKLQEMEKKHGSGSHSTKVT